MKYLFKIFAVLGAVAVTSVAHPEVPLTKAAYQKYGDAYGIVVLHVNWGRYWGCGGQENAQLQVLEFKLLGDVTLDQAASEISLAPRSKLLDKANFEPYAFIVAPGEYALSAAKLKVAGGVNDIRISSAEAAALIVNGEAKGGSFTVGAGEVVYIGHFGVDCNGQPDLRRFYVEDPKQWAGYVSGFQKAFGFLKDKPVIYRLFKTKYFGDDYELPK